jgi:hypothetical protein
VIPAHRIRMTIFRIVIRLHLFNLNMISARGPRLSRAKPLAAFPDHGLVSILKRRPVFSKTTCT